MAEMISYLQVVISNIGDDYFGKVQWPNSSEELSEFNSLEWYQNPILCLNHFGARGWIYVQTNEQRDQDSSRVKILFRKTVRKDIN